MHLYVKGEVGRLTNQRAGEAMAVGNPGPEGSVSKLAYAELNKEMYAFIVDLLGMEGQVGYDYTFRRPEAIDVSATSFGPRYAFLRVRANSIEGGTSEIMRNILGEQVLGLPGEPRLDKDRPWSEVPR
jgi:alkylation response protein AidB-like acyl-CoA dehydrogenase